MTVVQEEEFEESVREPSVAFPTFPDNLEMDEFDFLLEDDQEFKDFMERKSTIIHNIERLSSARFPKNKAKQSIYVQKVEQIFNEEQEALLFVREAGRCRK